MKEHLRSALAGGLGMAVASEAHGIVTLGADELLVQVSYVPVAAGSSAQVLESVTVASLAAMLEAAGVEPPLTREAALAALPGGIREAAAAAWDTPPAPLSSEEAQALAARVADWSGSDEEIASALNAPDPAYPNPAYRTRRVRLAMRDLIEALPPATRVALMEHPARRDFTEDVRLQRHEAVVNWTGLFEDAGLLTPAEAGALRARVLATEAESPEQEPALPWSCAVLGRAVHSSHVAAARPTPEG